ncbi:hydrogenase small subunit [Eggerthellaceae bacterium zg-1084]|uniref:Hydrogenase small subunit n=2 Tax=Berryella wangjianweii TaxID=2734634 RepID=A0A6M8J3C8_9ACTN|nr:hydrogenase small subunit [Berryella wangjianweii]QKF08004.1 hydrogenase small subunit [Berryella wangjianweii]
MLESRGVTRRRFMEFCGALAVAAGLSSAAAPKVAEAVEESLIGRAKGKLYPVLWIEGASCTGCTESFAQLETPDVGTVVLELLSLNYSDVLSAGAGESLEKAKEQTIAAGDYLLVYEGAVVERWEGNALRVAGLPGVHHLEEAAENARAVVALGSCAVNGGWMSAAPNAAGATGVMAYLKKKGIHTPVINVPGCPANPEHLMAVLTEVLMLGPNHLQLDGHNRPAQIFGQTVHDNCERRGHFENGEFVYKFGSKEEELGYCLYALGCRGPQTNSNCGVVMWNNRRSWCVQAGAPCIGCCEANPHNIEDNWVEVNTPFIARHRDLRVGNWMIQPDLIAFGVTGALAAALVVHGFGMKKAGRMDGGADFEPKRTWDAKHPDKAIGQYDEVVETPAASAAGQTKNEGR